MCPLFYSETLHHWRWANGKIYQILKSVKAWILLHWRNKILLGRLPYKYKFGLTINNSGFYVCRRVWRQVCRQLFRNQSILGFLRLTNQPFLCFRQNCNWLCFHYLEFKSICSILTKYKNKLGLSWAKLKLS